MLDGLRGELACNQVRQTLHVDGERLASVDLSCCQPALIAKIMASSGHGGEDFLGGDEDLGGDNFGGMVAEHTNQDETTAKQTSIYDSTIDPPDYGDFGLYCALVQAGTFYEYMLDHMNQQDVWISREQLKKRFLADVIAKRKANRYDAEYEDGCAPPQQHATITVC